ncbi:LacI family DNA-binding transcriptional regulator [Paenibacillus glycanilyticus]|uniref:DNA-binding transcriptional regulator CytR n=1 Tax=Paenibacillus glycanilyticus TaxID=126569 RepID=A0ABQ6G914_9BACL|nr:LacI family DNA-binding transcriptional regulator [Paenibacillus glycanilyticus]GLX66990.1 DNA-binding transcriptional regulator CytR [Paenibacillus glycanilyticus]
MVSRKDVAQLAGVSVAVVSYVLNGKNNVKEETRNRVLAAMQELKYEPNLLARSLKTQRTQQLAVFVNYLGNPFEAGILLRLEAAARQEGYLVFFQTYTPDLEQPLISALRGRVDGLVLLGQQLEYETFQRLKALDVPVLSVTQSPMLQEWGIPCIDLDWVKQYREAILFLKNKGHHRIAYMTDTVSGCYHLHRLRAFQEAIRLEGLALPEQLILDGGGKVETATPMFHDFIEQNASNLPMSALVCSNDLMAAAVVDACKTNSIKVPEQLAIIGSEDILMTQHTDPKLTVIHYPREMLGTLAMNMMKQLLLKSPMESFTVEGELLPRGTA